MGWFDLTWNWNNSRPNTTCISCIIIQLNVKDGIRRITINITATCCCRAGVNNIDRKSDLIFGSISYINDTNNYCLTHTGEQELSQLLNEITPGKYCLCWLVILIILWTFKLLSHRTSAIITLILDQSFLHLSVLRSTFYLCSYFLHFKCQHLNRFSIYVLSFTWEQLWHDYQNTSNNAIIKQATILIHFANV